MKNRIILVQMHWGQSILEFQSEEGKYWLTNIFQLVLVENHISRLDDRTSSCAIGIPEGNAHVVKAF